MKHTVIGVVVLLCLLCISFAVYERYAANTYTVLRETVDVHGVVVDGHTYTLKRQSKIRKLVMDTETYVIVMLKDDQEWAVLNLRSEFQEGASEPTLTKNEPRRVEYSWRHSKVIVSLDEGVLRLAVTESDEELVGEMVGNTKVVPLR